MKAFLNKLLSHHTLPENLMQWGKIAFWWSMAYLGFRLAQVFGG